MPHLVVRIMVQICIAGEISPCTIGLYCVEVSLREKSNAYRMIVEEKYLLVGKTESGEALNNNDCKKILELPVKDFAEDGHKSPAWLKGTNARGHELDGLIPKDEILQSCIENATPAITEEIERLRRITTRQKAKLEYAPNDMKTQIGNLNKELENISDRIKQAKITRKISLLQKELRQRQEGLYKEYTLLDEELKRKIEDLTAGQNWAVGVTRQFVIKIGV